MKLNGTLILILAVTLVAVTGIAWTQNMDRAICPLTGEAPICIGDGSGPYGLMGQHYRPARMAAALGLTGEQREAMLEIMTADREATWEWMEIAMADILTPEQLDQLEEIKTRPGWIGVGRADRPARRLEQMTGNLDLTPAQQQEVLVILEEAAPAPGFETRDKVRAVLTPEQQEQMDQQCQQRTPGMGQGIRPGMGRGVGPGMGQGVGPGMGRGVGPGMGQGVGPGIGRGMGRGVGSGMGRGARPGMGRGMGQGIGPGMGRGMWRNPHVRGLAGGMMGYPGSLAQQLQLTDEQHEAVRQLMTEIRSEQRSQTRSKIEALLTPEQQEKLEQLHQNQPLFDN